MRTSVASFTAALRRSIAAAILGFPVLAGAQGQIIPRICAPPPCTNRECGDRPASICPQGNPIVRTSSNVRVEMLDRVLRYEVNETFVNRGVGLGEADYIFPLPQGAAFEDLQLSINGELVSGETMGAGDARRIYEDIVRRRRDPALVEWMGSGLLRARIFPIQAGEEKRVVVRFQTVAAREGNALRVDYVRGMLPNAVSVPRPLPVMRDDAIANHRDDEPVNAFTLTYVLSDALGNPYSPTHTLHVNDRAGRRMITATGDGREITVLIPLRGRNVATLTVLANRTPDEDGFALITITPPVARQRATPRDLTFVVDVSGSMRGQKLEQAKAAGRALLETLGSGDRFRLIDFSTDVRAFRDSFVAATEANLRAARRYLDDLVADGSTNISGALEAALDQSSSDARLPLIVFVTDGEPTVGERNPDAIAALAARRRGSARIFSVGVSADVNSALIEQLALEGHGTAQFVRTGESVDRAVGLLATRLTSPVLTDVRIHADGVRLTQMHPMFPLDLFAGQDLIVLARYNGSGEASLRVEGRSAEGPVSWTTMARFPDQTRANPFVPRLWAAQRLGWLAAEKRKNGGTSEMDAEIKSLGEKYGIPTEFSSYLVLEPGMDVAARGGLGGRIDRTAPVPAAAPMAVSQEARFERAKQSAAQRAARNLAEVDSVSQAALQKAVRQIGTRQFAQQSFAQQQGVWVDLRYAPTQRIVKVKAYSPLYFDLVSKLSGLAETLVLGDQMVIAGRKVAIQIGADGAERMADRELAELLNDW
jgi:Ca-activated chloride channel homolog